MLSLLWGWCEWQERTQQQDGIAKGEQDKEMNSCCNMPMLWYGISVICIPIILDILSNILGGGSEGIHAYKTEENLLFSTNRSTVAYVGKWTRKYDRVLWDLKKKREWETNSLRRPLLFLIKKILRSLVARHHLWLLEILWRCFIATQYRQPNEARLSSRL